MFVLGGRWKYDTQQYLVFIPTSNFNDIDIDRSTIEDDGNDWGWYGASLGGPLCNTSKMYVRQVRLASHESKTTQKAQIT